MMLRGLGATTVAVVDNPNDCPRGTRAVPIATAAMAAYSTVKYECLQGESWLCEWFGIGCRGVEPPPLPAPQTREQMSVPGAWTPEDVSRESAEEYRVAVENHFESTRGVAMVPAYAHRTGRAVADAVTGPVPWTLVGLVLGAAVIIGLRRL